MSIQSITLAIVLIAATTYSQASQLTWRPSTASNTPCLEANIKIKPSDHSDSSEQQCLSLNYCPEKKDSALLLNRQTCLPNMEQNTVVMEKSLLTDITDTDLEKGKACGNLFFNELNSYFMAPSVIAIEAVIHLQKAWSKGSNCYWGTFCPHRSSRPRELFFLAVYATEALLNMIEYQLPQMTEPVEGCSYQIETFASHMLVHALMAFGSVLAWQKDCNCVNPYVNPHVVMMTKHLAQLTVMTALGMSSYMGF